MSLNMISSRSIHLASSGVTSLFFIAEKYSIVYMKHNFIHSSVDEHLYCLHVLAVVKSAAVKMGCMYFAELWFSQDICPRVGLLDLMVALFLVFKGNCVLFSMMAAPIYIPTNSVGGFSFFSSPSPAFIVCRPFDWWPFWPVWGDTSL